MEKLQINVDKEATKAYRIKYEQQCSCAYCRNYYKTFTMKYPQTSKLLTELGLDTAYPLEIMPFQFDHRSNEKEYMSFYRVKGNMDEHEINLVSEELAIHIFKGSHEKNPCPNPQMEEPYILIGISGIRLPWVMDEDPE